MSMESRSQGTPAQIQEAKKFLRPEQKEQSADREGDSKQLTPAQEALLNDCNLSVGPQKGRMLGLATGALGSPGGGGAAFFRRVIAGKTPEGRVEITFDPDTSGSDTIWSATAKIDGKEVSDEEALKLAYKYRAIAEFQTKYSPEPEKTKIQALREKIMDFLSQ